MPKQMQAASHKERVRAFRTHPTLILGLCRPQVGCMAQPRMRLVIQATACLKSIFSLAFHATDDPIFKTPPFGFFGIGGGIGSIVDKNIEVGLGTG